MSTLFTVSSANQVANTCKVTNNEYPANNTYGRRWNEQYFEGMTLSDQLKRAARNNDTEAIDYLFTIACDGGSVDAESRSNAANFFLYQLYKEEKDKNSLLYQQLGRDSLKLFEIVSARNKRYDARIKHSGDGHWRISAEIMFMAENTANTGSQLHSDIVCQLSARETPLEEPLSADESDAAAGLAAGEAHPVAVSHESPFSMSLQNARGKELIKKGFVTKGLHRNWITRQIRGLAPSFYRILHAEKGDAKNMFALNRMITSAEIDAVSNALNNQQEKCQFHAALKIPKEAARNGIVDRQLGLLLENQKDQDFFVPLLLREHWVLLGVKSTDGDKKGVIFSSSDKYLTDAELTYLEKLLSHYGSHKNYILKGDLQNNMPNACGLLVTEMMRRVAEQPGKDVTATWQEMSALFSGHFPDADMNFNRKGRIALYGTLLDSCERADPVQRSVSPMLASTRF